MSSLWGQRSGAGHAAHTATLRLIGLEVGRDRVLFDFSGSDLRDGHGTTDHVCGASLTPGAFGHG